MKVKDIMRRDIIKINSDATVEDAIKKMFDENVTSLIVNSSDGKDIYGIITRKDIVNKVIAYNKDINEVRVRDIMTEPILTISQDIDLMNAASLMAKADIRRFPVINNGEMVGIVSNSDIVRAFSKSRQEIH